MLACFVEHSKVDAIPILLVTQRDYPSWLSRQKVFIKHWLTSSGYRPLPGTFALVPNQKGQLTEVICCLKSEQSFWDVGALPWQLPEGYYRFVNEKNEKNEKSEKSEFILAWALGAYEFTRYKSKPRAPAKLVLGKSGKRRHGDALALIMAEAIYQVRDLINTPTDDLGPSELAAVVRTLAKDFAAHFKQWVGGALLKANFPAIYAVGRASDDAPRLLELRWGHRSHPKVTLVGKGVCFDTGGLNLKTASAMQLMKKDMGGAAHVLGLARMIMEAELPVALRVLIPAVENAVSGAAYRPGDVLSSRKGVTIEIGNTDAEGRVVLADALTLAVEEEPELLIDFATLTGAARIALGTELPAVMTNTPALWRALWPHAEKHDDPIWQLPLFKSYRDLLGSQIADINNSGADAYAGAITAGLFLQTFVPDDIAWLHYDIMAWNLKSRPGRPQGGEAMGLRSLFAYLCERYLKR